MATPCKSCEQLVEELAELRRLLAEAEDGRFRGLLDGLAATDVGVDIIGADHRILYQNSVLVDRFGDVTGKLCYESYCGRREPCESCPMIRSLATGGVERAEVTGLDERRYEVLSAPLPGPDGSADRGIELVLDVTERNREEEALQQRTDDLGERVKELGCLYNAAELMSDSGRSLKDVLQGITDLIPPAWQYPEITCARITYEGREFASGNFEETDWQLAADIVLSGGTVGAVEVCYLEERPESDEGPFLKEERDLVNDVARQLGVMIQRERALAALAERERYFRSLMQSMHEDILVIDRDYVITDVNNTFVQAVGRTREEVIGKHCYEVSHGYAEPCDRHGERCGARETFETGEARRHRHVHTCADGSKAHVDILYSAVKDEAGNVTRVVEAMRDVTDLMEAHDALRNSEARYRAIFEGAAEGILVADVETRRFTYANPAACRMLGYSEEELTRLGVADIHPKDALERVFAAFEAQARGEMALAPELPCLRKDGSVFYADIMTAPAVIDGRKRNVGFFTDVTERMRAEEALRASERRLRSVFQAASSVAFVTTDLEGVDAHILDFSPGAERIFGYSREEVVGQPLAILHVPEDVNGFPAVIEAVRRRGKGLTDEVQLVRKSGQRFPAILTVLPMLDDAGDIVGLLGVSIDITERKAAEADLRFQSAILARIRDLVVATDLKGRITFVNDTVCEALRRSREELVGQSVELFGEEPKQGATQREIIERTRIDGAWQGEVVNVTADGQEIILDCRTQLLRNDAGEPIGMVGVSTDVTERKRAEEALRNSEARFRSLFEHAPLGYQSLDAKGNIVHVNPAWLETLGYERADEVVGRWFGDFLAPDEASHLAATYARFAEAGALRNVEWEMLRKDGTRIVALLNGRAVEDAEGRFQHMHCTMQDITARKRAERNLARRAEILSRQVQERYDMVGESPPMQALYEFLHKAAPTEAGVLICGESGVGKEMVARAVHNNSHRSHGPLEIVNCGAIPLGLLDSELFGHVRGAFTGAVADKPGRFELADGGTLFLDEITTMPLECQAKLLRVIEEGKVRRIGATRDRTVSVRLMAATNSDPAQAVAAGILREDVFYRLDRLRVVVPPLRERADDIPLLAEHFLEVCSASLKGKVNSFDPEVHEVFRAYRWPGNVRELKNVVERMVILADGPELGLDLVPGDLRRAADSPKDHDVQSLDETERQQIVRALDEADGNKSQAARMLGIDRSTLYAKLRHYGMLR